MQEVLGLIHKYHEWFYLITFVWTALEGETFVIFAALAAKMGFLNIVGLFTAAWLGSFFGDQVFFWLGRVYGKRILERFPKIKPKTDRVLKAIEKYDVIYIMSYRFMYGIRNISGVAIGLSQLSWKRFAVLNFIAAFIWAFAFCFVGYQFGSVIHHFGRRKSEVVSYTVHELTLTVLGLFVFIVLIRMGVRWFQSRKILPTDEN